MSTAGGVDALFYRVPLYGNPQQIKSTSSAGGITALRAAFSGGLPVEHHKELTMKHITAARNQPKGWSVGPWNSGVPSAVGYANEGIQECHYHQEMYELYLVAQGSSTALVNDQEIELEAGDILVVEPGEVHTFLASSEGYFHFVIQTPFVPGDKQAMAPR